MADSTNNETAEATPAEQNLQEEAQSQATTDTKLLLAPLAKYAVLAVLMVAVIVSAAVMLNDDLDTIDEQVATIEAELVEQHLAATETDNMPVVDETLPLSTVATASEQVAQAEEIATENTSQAHTQEPVDNNETAVDENPVTEVVSTEKAVVENEVVKNETVASAVVENEVANNDVAESEVSVNEAADNVVTSSVVEEPAAAETVTATKASETATPAFVSRDAELKARIAEHHARIAQQDEEYLESFKSRQAEQIEWLRQQLVRQEQRIQEIEKRNQEAFEMRAANIRRMQQAREESLDRI